jgi:hypothetical protein
MLKSVTRTMLTRAMGFAWDLIKVGERVVAYAESWEVTETNAQRASFVELTVWRTGNVIVGTGERLELGVNSLAMRLGWDDGEVSSLVAWPALAH